VTTSRNAKRSEKAGLFNFGKEMITAFGFALIMILYVIQAFRIPSGSMEKSLLIGDFLLGLKFYYGSPVLPFSFTKFPGVADPQPGDVIIFKYPGSNNRDYIKRCVAGPGDTVEIHGTRLLVNGDFVKLPPRGQHISNGNFPAPAIRDFDALVIPQKGDTLHPPGMPVREFLFCKHLITQEHPRNGFVMFLENAPVLRALFAQDPRNAKVRIRLQLYLDSTFANDAPLSFSSGRGGRMQRPFSFINEDPRLNYIDNWLVLERYIDDVRRIVHATYPDKQVQIRKMVYLKGEPVTEYVVQHDNYFMMGDNRDNSTDSRFWGYLNRTFVKARAFIIYFSLDRDVPLWLLPAKIRWARIGQLIRSYHHIEQMPRNASSTE
jgi:signal peptidase I